MRNNTTIERQKSTKLNPVIAFLLTGSVGIITDHLLEIIWQWLVEFLQNLYT